MLVLSEKQSCSLGPPGRFSRTPRCPGSHLRTAALLVGVSVGPTLPPPPCSNWLVYSWCPDWETCAVNCAQAVFRSWGRPSLFNCGNLGAAFCWASVFSFVKWEVWTIFKLFLLARGFWENPVTGSRGRYPLDSVAVCLLGLRTYAFNSWSFLSTEPGIREAVGSKIGPL